MSSYGTSAYAVGEYAYWPYVQPQKVVYVPMPYPAVVSNEPVVERVTREDVRELIDLVKELLKRSDADG